MSCTRAVPDTICRVIQLITCVQPPNPKCRECTQAKYFIFHNLSCTNHKKNLAAHRTIRWAKEGANSGTDGRRTMKKEMQELWPSNHQKINQKSGIERYARTQVIHQPWAAVMEPGELDVGDRRECVRSGRQREAPEKGLVASARWEQYRLWPQQRRRESAWLGGLGGAGRRSRTPSSLHGWEPMQIAAATTN
jgi:hypothetical protein